MNRNSQNKQKNNLFSFFARKRTPSASQWTLCSMKDGSENKANQIQFEARNINNETQLYPTGVASNAYFDIDIPAYGGFERQLEFHGNFQSTDVVSYCIFSSFVAHSFIRLWAGFPDFSNQNFSKSFYSCFVSFF